MKKKAREVIRQWTNRWPIKYTGAHLLYQRRRFVKVRFTLGKQRPLSYTDRPITLITSNLRLDHTRL